MSLDRGSSLIVGLLVIYDALVAYVRVDRFYSIKLSLGLIQATIRLYEFPPIDCFKMDVSLESLYGTWTLSLVFVFPASAKTLITCLKVNKDLLISMLYLANFPYVPVMPILYDPAKSTNSILLDKICVGSE